jgi:hypothetical protein
MECFAVAGVQVCWSSIKRRGNHIIPRTILRIAGMALLCLPVHSSCAEERLEEPAKSSARAAATSLFQIGEIAQGAADLRKAGEAFERFAKSANGTVEIIAKSLAAMSSEFDPFGYKTAFRTIGRQAEIIQQQSKAIQTLQDREIERLRRENHNLKRQLRALRKK